MYEYKAIVDRVVDGDTIKCTIDLGFSTWKKVTVRMEGINTPESRTRDLEEKERGLAAKARLQEILEYNGNINLTNTDNRKIIGNMNNLVYLYKHIMEYDYEINKIIIKANNMPQRNLKWLSSTEALYKIIET